MCQGSSDSRPSAKTGPKLGLQRSPNIQGTQFARWASQGLGQYASAARLKKKSPLGTPEISLGDPGNEFMKT